LWAPGCAAVARTPRRERWGHPAPLQPPPKQRSRNPIGALERSGADHPGLAWTYRSRGRSRGRGRGGNRGRSRSREGEEAGSGAAAEAGAGAGAGEGRERRRESSAGAPRRGAGPGSSWRALPKGRRGAPVPGRRRSHSRAASSAAASWGAPWVCPWGRQALVGRHGRGGRCAPGEAGLVGRHGRGGRCAHGCWRHTTGRRCLCREEQESGAPSQNGTDLEPSSPNQNATIPSPRAPGSPVPQGALAPFAREGEEGLRHTGPETGSASGASPKGGRNPKLERKATKGVRSTQKKPGTGHEEAVEQGAGQLKALLSSAQTAGGEGATGVPQPGGYTDQGGALPVPPRVHKGQSQAARARQWGGPPAWVPQPPAPLRHPWRATRQPGRRRRARSRSCRRGAPLGTPPGGWGVYHSSGQSSTGKRRRERSQQLALGLVAGPTGGAPGLGAGAQYAGVWGSEWQSPGYAKQQHPGYAKQQPPDAPWLPVAGLSGGGWAQPRRPGACRCPGAPQAPRAARTAWTGGPRQGAYQGRRLPWGRSTPSGSPAAGLPWHAREGGSPGHEPGPTVGYASGSTGGMWGSTSIPGW